MLLECVRGVVCVYLETAAQLTDKPEMIRENDIKWYLTIYYFSNTLAIKWWKLDQNNKTLQQQNIENDQYTTTKRHENKI